MNLLVKSAAAVSREAQHDSVRKGEAETFGVCRKNTNETKAQNFIERKVLIKENHLHLLLYIFKIHSFP